MKKTVLKPHKAYRFRKFSRKRFAVFNSLHRVINIGVISGCMLTFAATTQTSAQNRISTGEASSVPEQELDEVTVTSSPAETTLDRTTKIVTVITRSEIERQPAVSVQDLLKNIAGLDVRQRGANGTLAGVSVRGGTFEQTAILLNGINIANPQTGHYNLDIPVNLSDIERIEIIQGPASLLYGAGAFSGGINIITKKDNTTSLSLGLESGMHSLFGANARGSLAKPAASHSISAGYASSAGYIPNSDYRLFNALYQSHYLLDESGVSLQFGINDKEYGANTFYSAAYPSQFDDTQSLFGAISSETGTKLKLSQKLYWNRHYDNFHLYRPGTPDIPSWYTEPNRHFTDVSGLNLNARYRWTAGITVLGGEIRSESITSSNLGKDSIFNKQHYHLTDNRTNISYFLEHTYRHKQFTFGLGLLFNYNTAFKDDLGLFPGISTAFRLSDNIKLFASWNRAVRIPTFTDLYYKGATHEGNSDIRPEKSESIESGIKYGNSIFTASLNAFYMKGINLIDWVKLHPDDKWQSRNLTNLNKTGIEANITLITGKLLPRLGASSRLNIGYTFTSQNKYSGEWISNYVLDYLRNKLTAGISHTIHKNLSADWQFRFNDRQGTWTKYENNTPAGHEEPYHDFSLLDLKLNLQFHQFNIYLTANNLFNVSYLDIGNIPQPGLWLSGGIKAQLR